MYKINKQHGYIAQHRKIYPLFCINFKWGKIYKNTESQKNKKEDYRRIPLERW